MLRRSLLPTTTPPSSSPTHPWALKWTQRAHPHQQPFVRQVSAQPRAGGSSLTARLAVDTDFAAPILLTLPTSVRRCSSSSQRPYARSMPPTNATDWSTMTSFSWWAQRYTEEDTWSGCLITCGQEQHPRSAPLPSRASCQSAAPHVRLLRAAAEHWTFERSIHTGCWES